MSDDTTKTTTCARCGQPIELAGDVGAEMLEVADQLGRSASFAVTHEICPTSTEDLPAAPGRRFRVDVTVVEEGEAGDETLASFSATAEGQTYTDAGSSLSDQLSERWTKLQQSAHLLG